MCLKKMGAKQSFNMEIIKVVQSSNKENDTKQVIVDLQIAFSRQMTLSVIHAVIRKKLIYSIGAANKEVTC